MSETIQAPAELSEKQLSDRDSALNSEVHVYNDDAFPMDRVMTAFCKVIPGMNSEKAERVMLTIHNDGVGTVWGGPREVCELYAEQLNGHGLDARVA